MQGGCGLQPVRNVIVHGRVHLQRLVSPRDTDGVRGAFHGTIPGNDFRAASEEATHRNFRVHPGAARQPGRGFARGPLLHRQRRPLPTGEGVAESTTAEVAAIQHQSLLRLQVLY